NDGSEGIIIVQVYWDMDTYNALHSLAFALRWSVSHLIFVMLCLAEEGIVPGAENLETEDGGMFFSNYCLKVKMWGTEGYIYTEFLRFSTTRPPATTTRGRAKQ
ncbi:MAG: hypothetical protein N2Z22_09685, partial [Turneriella sp.]|nr:hypothetical protein [Turneriella sp.]